MHRPITPPIAADIIIELMDRPERPILLIERKYPPLGWAIPGGFMDVGESVEQTALREAQEEVCLPVTLKTLLGVYSDPQRDPRGQTVSVVYVAEAWGEPRAADDAANVQAFSPDDLPQTLAFDHAQILQDYLRYRTNDEHPFPGNSSDQ
jgi:8-oxo-dGTP diphosphatase